MANPVVAVSPHLDDLALSCGTYLAARPGSILVTVFAGGPASVDPLPWWDQECGVAKPGDDVVGMRRAEDRRAAETLEATVVHLEFWDNHYREPIYGYEGPTGDLVDAIAHEVEATMHRLEPTTWLVPLGILHPDHRAAAAACLDLAERHPDVEWLLYEELPYATRCPRDRRLALEELAGRGFTLDDELAPASGVAGDRKERAVACYPSQLAGLAEQVDEALATPERIHRLSRRG
jgi:LmbE family N-acetylglucosaminyl deacetylase